MSHTPVLGRFQHNIHQAISGTGAKQQQAPTDARRLPTRMCAQALYRANAGLNGRVRPTSTTNTGTYQTQAHIKDMPGLG